MVRRASSWPFVVVVLCVSGLVPAHAFGQALPPVDDFLGVRILTAGASTPGAPVSLVNGGNIVKAGPTDAGLTLTNLSGGYDASVLDPIRNFSASGYTFTTIGVANANNTAGTIGSPVTARRIAIDEGNPPPPPPPAGPGGTFTLTAGGNFTYNPGTDFADIAVGAKVRVAVNYTVRGVSPGGVTRDMAATM